MIRYLILAIGFVCCLLAQVKESKLEHTLRLENVELRAKIQALEQERDRVVNERAVLANENQHLSNSQAGLEQKANVLTDQLHTQTAQSQTREKNLVADVKEAVKQTIVAESKPPVLIEKKETSAEVKHIAVQAQKNSDAIAKSVVVAEATKERVDQTAGLIAQIHALTENLTTVTAQLVLSGRQNGQLIMTISILQYWIGALVSLTVLVLLIFVWTNVPTIVRSVKNGPTIVGGMKSGPS